MPTGPLLWLHYKIAPLFYVSTAKILNWNHFTGLVFHWCFCNKQNITWPLGDTKVLISYDNILYFPTLEEEFRISRVARVTRTTRIKSECSTAVVEPYNLPITISDALPLSCRRLLEARPLYPWFGWWLGKKSERSTSVSVTSGGYLQRREAVNSCFSIY